MAKMAALVNDTVGTLMVRSYTAPGNGAAVLVAIFGTGTNGAYVEKTPPSKVDYCGNHNFGLH